MFGSKKRKEMAQDPQKGLDYADKKLNKGLTGLVSKAFLGKDTVESMNETLSMGQNALDMQKSAQELRQSGLAAEAEVVGIQDTGQLINYDPVVVLQLKVTPEVEAPFDTVVQTLVSKIAVPRVGDIINIKYDPADRSRIAIV